MHPGQKVPGIVVNEANKVAIIEFPLLKAFMFYVLLNGSLVLNQIRNGRFRRIRFQEELGEMRNIWREGGGE